jgi:hypothetical protein
MSSYNELWGTYVKFKDTIQRVHVLIKEYNQLAFSDLSMFPRLQQVIIGFLHGQTMVLQLNELLDQNRNLRSIVFSSTFLSASPSATDTISRILSQPAKITIRISGEDIHMNAMLFILQIATKLEALSLNFDKIHLDSNQDERDIKPLIQQLYDIPIDKMRLGFYRYEKRIYMYRWTI